MHAVLPVFGGSRMSSIGCNIQQREIPSWHGPVDTRKSSWTTMLFISVETREEPSRKGENAGEQ
jgi:hypothetical protein